MTRNASEPINLGSQKHLFIDFSLADQVEDVRLRVNLPHVGGVAIHRDRAWEHHLHWTNTVIDDDGLARMWYPSSHMGAGNLNTFSLGVCRVARWGPLAQTESRPRRVEPCHREQPHPGSGGKRLQRPHGSSRRSVTKAFGSTEAETPARPDSDCFTSADGLRFTWKGGNGVELIGDTQNQAFWDERIGRYVAYFRNWVPTGL